MRLTVGVTGGADWQTHTMIMAQVYAKHAANLRAIAPSGARCVRLRFAYHNLMFLRSLAFASSASISILIF